MFHDLLVGLGETFPAAEVAAREQAEDDAATGTCTKGSQVEEDNASAVGGDWLAETGRRNRSPPSPPVFHVTEYDVTKGQYPETWEKFAGASDRPDVKRGHRCMWHVDTTLAFAGRMVAAFLIRAWQR